MTMAVTYGTLAGQTVYEERGGTERVYVPDPLGSTAMLTDAAGSVTDTFRYWAYGEERVRTGTTATPFRFVGTLGYYRDAVARLYVRLRVYSATLARWMTADPLWPRESAFGYVGGRPSIAVDPLGLMVIVGILPCNPAECSAAGNACVLSICFRNGVPSPGPACDAAAGAHYNACNKPFWPMPTPPGWRPIPTPGQGGVFPPKPPAPPPACYRGGDPLSCVTGNTTQVSDLTILDIRGCKQCCAGISGGQADLYQVCANGCDTAAGINAQSGIDSITSGLFKPGR